jgi:hypothetical protein
MVRVRVLPNAPFAQFPFWAKRELGETGIGRHRNWAKRELGETGWNPLFNDALGCKVSYLLRHPVSQSYFSILIV